MGIQLFFFSIIFVIQLMFIHLCVLVSPETRHSLDALHKQLNRINDDIAVKQYSLDLENKCIDLRYERMDRSQPETDIDPAKGQPRETKVLTTVTEAPTTIQPELAGRLLA